MTTEYADDHEHTFSETLHFVFEDELVAELTDCTIPGCEATNCVQYRVDFNSFVKEGEELTESAAKELWETIVSEYGVRPEITNEWWQSDSVEYLYTGGRNASYYYDAEFDDLQAVQLFVDDVPIRFDVEFYRDLGA